jgi:hypothetical protein
VAWRSKSVGARLAGAVFGGAGSGEATGVARGVGTGRCGVALSSSAGSAAAEAGEARRSTAGTGCADENDQDASNGTQTAKTQARLERLDDMGGVGLDSGSRGGGSLQLGPATPMNDLNGSG